MSELDALKINFKIENLEELKKLLQSTLEAIEVVEKNIEKINSFELEITQKSV